MRTLRDDKERRFFIKCIFANDRQEVVVMSPALETRPTLILITRNTHTRG